MRGFWLSGLMALGLSACGHIPGYYPDDEAPRAAAGPERPKGPPAPPPGARRPADEADDFDDTADATAPDESAEPVEADEAEPMDEAPPYVPPPKPPRYTPPSTWEPPAPAAPAPQPVQPSPQPTRVAPPSREADAPADGVKTIRLDADTYYLVDTRRNLCFLRHKESMTAVDCAKIVDPGAPSPAPAPTPTPTPSRVEPAAPSPAPAPTKVEPATPTPDETTRFEAAFTDIFCDRKNRDETPPEARIRARGLSIERYEAIEGWWAGDENAWFALTSKAARSCRR